MKFVALFVQDYLLSEMDCLSASGRLPSKNIEAAKAKVNSIMDHIEAQDDDYIPDTVASDNAAMEDFIRKVTADMAA
jgi:hypothetical protein